MRKVQWSATVIATCILISACSSPAEKTGEKDNTPYSLSAWVVDWQGEAGISEIRNANGGIHQISLFAAYFGTDTDVYLPGSSAELMSAAFEEDTFLGKEFFLTIVNDQFLDDGRIIQKNPEILREILETPGSRGKHVDQILNHALAYPLSGVELDYEQIPADLIEPYLEFLGELRDALSEKGLSLRVVLEPGFSTEPGSLPNGITYTVMAYNLHGPHSGPGPKADSEFIGQLKEKFPVDSGEIGMALATGGFSWQGGEVKQLTEVEAMKLAENSGSHVTRDDRSGALHFKYVDSGLETEVWYADAKTLERWMAELYKGGYTEFSIWRMGGLSDETLEFLSGG